MHARAFQRLKAPRSSTIHSRMAGQRVVDCWVRCQKKLITPMLPCTARHLTVRATASPEREVSSTTARRRASNFLLAPLLRQGIEAVEVLPL